MTDHFSVKSVYDLKNGLNDAKYDLCESSGVSMSQTHHTLSHHHEYLQFPSHHYLYGLCNLCDNWCWVNDACSLRIHFQELLETISQSTKTCTLPGFPLTCFVTVLQQICVPGHFNVRIGPAAGDIFQLRLYTQAIEVFTVACGGNKRFMFYISKTLS